MLSRAKPAINKNESDLLIETQPDPKKQEPKLEKFVEKRDFLGAVTLLEFLKASGKNTTVNMFWLGYCQFHLGEYQHAMETYQTMALEENCDPLVHLYLGCCYFFLGMYKEADESAQKGPTCKLQNRLLFHLSHKFNDEKRLMGYHQNLQDVIEDQVNFDNLVEFGFYSLFA